MPTFACPYCRERVPVPVESVGSAVLCTSCGRPFRPQVPEGPLVEEHEGAWHGVAALRAPGDERVITRVHPAAFRRAPVRSAVLFLVAGAALTIAILVAARYDDPWLVGLSVLTGVAIALLALAPLVVAFVETRFESLTITSQRSVLRRGILTKSTSEVQHDDIRNIQVRQGLLDQLLQVGTVSISSAGQDDMEIVASGVPRPGEVVELVRAYQRRLEKDD